MDHLLWKPFLRLAVLSCLASTHSKYKEIKQCWTPWCFNDGKCTDEFEYRLPFEAHLYLVKEMVAKLPLSRHWAVSMSSLCYCARWHAGWKCRLWYTRAFTLPLIISALYCKAPAEDVCVRFCEGLKACSIQEVYSWYLWVYQVCEFQG